MHYRFLLATIASLGLVASFTIYPKLSQAETVDVTGLAGANGIDGSPTVDGTNGGVGGGATAIAILDASNTANATGGAGGNGGLGNHAGNGKIIRLRNFATLVPDNVRCASACALAWLGGAVRFMGPQAQIGFHAAYVVQGGQASETGVGNALVGAYLANIGLPDSAVTYVTQASPRAMTWLNIAEAQQRGIDVSLFTPPQNEVSPQANSQRTHAPPPGIELSRQATDLIVSLLVRWSGPNSAYALQLFNTVYAPQVSYYGAIRTKQEVLQDKLQFSERWPQRRYRVRDGSLNARCDAAISTCSVSGIVDWEVGSTNRNAKSSGSAGFIYGLKFVGQSVLIVQEGGSVLDRNQNGTPPLR
jgi:hypothetical protein